MAGGALHGVQRLAADRVRGQRAVDRTAHGLEKWSKVQDHPAQPLVDPRLHRQAAIPQRVQRKPWVGTVNTRRCVQGARGDCGGRPQPISPMRGRLAGQRGVLLGTTSPFEITSRDTPSVSFADISPTRVETSDSRRDGLVHRISAFPWEQ